jgi:hypothetical protein
MRLLIRRRNLEDNGELSIARLCGRGRTARLLWDAGNNSGLAAAAASDEQSTEDKKETADS